MNSRSDRIIENARVHLPGHVLEACQDNAGDYLLCWQCSAIWRVEWCGGTIESGAIPMPVTQPPFDPGDGSCSKPDRPAPNTVVIYTTAPEAYDGFGAVREPAGFIYWNKPLFRITIPQEHAEWFRMRCGSGLHATFSQSDLDEFQVKWPANEDSPLQPVEETSNA